MFLQCVSSEITHILEYFQKYSPFSTTTLRIDCLLFAFLFDLNFINNFACEMKFNVYLLYIVENILNEN